MKLSDLTVGERYAFKTRGGTYLGRLTGVRQPYKRTSYRGAGTFLGYSVEQNDGCTFTDVRSVSAVASDEPLGAYLKDATVTVGCVLSPEAAAVSKNRLAQADYEARRFAEDRAVKLAEALTQATGQTCRVASPGNYPGARYDMVANPMTLAQSLLATIDAAGPLADVHKEN